MELLYPVCCGIDVHQEMLTACVRRAGEGGKVQNDERQFSTMMFGLRELADWLESSGCGVVVMESTGVYWRPVHNVLRQRVKEVLVANPRDVRQRPGRKTDRADARWLAELLAHGLIQPSFVPEPELVVLRDLTRLRTKLVEERTAHKNRVYKVLEDSNIKLGSVVSKLFCKSGLAMLERLLAGEQDPEQMADLAKGRLRKKLPELRLALEGNFTENHARLIGVSLESVEVLNRQIAGIEAAIAEAAKDYLPYVERLSTIPGIQETTALQILSEIGTDMSRFGSAERLASWAGLCPGNNTSAGKSRSGRTSKANRYLRRTMVECAWAASKTKSGLGQKFRQLQVRLGGKKAAVAIGHKIFVIVFHLLQRGGVYEDGHYGDLSKKQEDRLLNRSLKTLAGLGYSVVLERIVN